MSPPASQALRTHLMHGLSGLAPAYFGLVMATGIVSMAVHLQGWSRIAQALFYLNHVLYAVLWGLALLLWLGLTCAIFMALTVKAHKPTLDKGISGGWLLAVVTTQSVAVLAALLAAHADQPYRLEFNFLVLSMWLWCGMLYIWMMSLIFYRYTFFALAPGDLSPPYWINMGAMAISTPGCHGCFWAWHWPPGRWRSGACCWTRCAAWGCCARMRMQRHPLSDWRNFS